MCFLQSSKETEKKIPTFLFGVVVESVNVVSKKILACGFPC